MTEDYFWAQLFWEVPKNPLLGTVKVHHFACDYTVPRTGVTLSNTNKEVKWEPDALKENGGVGEISLSAKGEHTLIIKQALLSPTAKDAEVNVIEVETTGYKGNIKQPIIALVGGKQSHLLLDLNFPDPPVTLRLIEGHGPVHISGNHVINAEQYNDDDDDEDDDDLDEFDEQGLEEEDEEDDAEAEEKKKEEKTGKKRTNSSSGQSQAKKKKKAGKDD